MEGSCGTLHAGFVSQTVAQQDHGAQALKDPLLDSPPPSKIHPLNHPIHPPFQYLAGQFPGFGQAAVLSGQFQIAQQLVEQTNLLKLGVRG